MRIERVAPPHSSAKCPRFSRLFHFNWKRYRARLLGFIRKSLGPGRSRYFDEDDFVQITFENFFVGVSDGRIDDWRRRDPWPLLAVIARRKMIDCFHYQNRRKRGGGRVQNESSLTRSNGHGDEQPLNRVPAARSAIGDVAWEERYELLLRKLKDPILRDIAVLKIDGYTNEEIAVETNCSRATVCRKLAVIRRIWYSDFEEQLSDSRREKRQKTAGS